MMTIKHIAEDGKESVTSVNRVEFDQKLCQLTGHVRDGDKTITVHYDRGHAFVMNENGKTVAVYNLRKR